MNRLTLENSNLIIATAHPDDELLHTGLITEALAAGNDVAVITATRGEGSTEYYGSQSAPNLQTDPEGFSEFLAHLRPQEQRYALGHVGVKEALMFPFDLPDGKLHQPRHRSSLQRHITRIAFGFHGMYGSNTVIVTPGEQGFDGHEDHITVHTRSVMAARALRARGIVAPVLSLNAEGQGGIVLPIDEKTHALKLGVMSNHSSQFPVDEQGDVDPEFLEYFYGLANGKYGAVMKQQETYDEFTFSL